MSARAIGGVGLLGMGVAAYLLLSRDTAGPTASPTPGVSPNLGPTPSPSPILSPDEAHDDETALARMLASEDPKNRGAQVVIGWITRERASRAHKSIYDFVTTGKGYGHMAGRHANTAQRPTPATRALARALLDEKIRPSLAIRRHHPGSWVERKIDVSDDRILELQAVWNEGIYARLAGSNWVLYSRDTPRISVARDLSSTDRLNALPQFPALEEAVA